MAATRDAPGPGVQAAAVELSLGPPSRSNLVVAARNWDAACSSEIADDASSPALAAVCRVDRSKSSVAPRTCPTHLDWAS